MRESYLPIRHPGTLKKVILDEASASLLYFGVAAPGALTSADVWQIQKIVIGPGNSVAITWADGNAEFDNVWDNRASLSYS